MRGGDLGLGDTAREGCSAQGAGVGERRRDLKLTSLENQGNKFHSFTSGTKSLGV